MRANELIVRDYARRSPVMTCLGCAGIGAEWRTMVAFDTKTLVRDAEGTIRRAGPVVVGIRYSERFLSEAPHPFELAAILEPRGVFHPNCDPVGAMCLGHPTPGISLEVILNQVWAGLAFNLKLVNTRPGEVANREAAEYVRACAEQFPITRRGLFEDPEEELRNRDWHAAFDRGAAGVEEQLARSGMGEGAP
jgi:hypothetical protein